MPSSKPEPGAGELHEDAIPHQLDDPSAMLGDQGLKDIRASGLERGQGSGLVRLHQARVPDHIGDQDGGKTAFHAKPTFTG
jgi:hypothetical protein